MQLKILRWKIKYLCDSVICDFVFSLEYLLNFVFIAPLWKTGGYTGFALSFCDSVIP